ncbi:methenyltetrahydromethanopterin cyclohydrolase [Thiorhodococcus minor]|uniref:Methenyltetrahydromethanopterin cyclohydrolase n=1 Tax=Thiorhodococcus minor TaxID=57489 RepID=A0A6M0K1J2_9GAMM|nr:methenyltetrahydromethanopterin cyclohydrolase [Thiorhodococcus minor]NEV63632.1 methenyltetrahydromethanopterin cyclohydrolase [Thiorhodococcus minor]
MTDRGLSINALTAPLVDALVADADQLRLGVHALDNGACIVDAGIAAPGGLEAGRRIAEICLGGLGRVALRGGGPVAGWPLSVEVTTSDPVMACLGSQYAGWSLSHGEGKGAFHALGSGPGRALACKEPLFAELGYRDQSDRGCLVLEVDKEPPAPLIEKIARDCGIAPSGLTLILTPTSSLAGTVQIVARVLEVALHKAHELGFHLGDIRDGLGAAPLPPPAPDFVKAMGRTNDAILFGGQVQLFAAGEDAAVERLARELPSSASRDYGRPFAEVFKAYGYDFFQVDPMLFSPARIQVTALDSGRTFTAGRIAPELLEASFGVAL